MKKSDEIDVIVDKSKLKDEKTITWETIRPYPDLARQLGARRGDVAKVEMGYEIKGKIKVESWFLSIVRPIGNNLYHYTKVYPRKRFKGATTAKMFMDEAYAYFKEKEIDYAAQTVN